MSVLKLKDRIEDYQKSSDYKLLNRVPVIISINGRGFSKLTSLLEKPYCQKLSECLLSTMHRLCSEIDGTVFAYQFNDEINLILRNDQTMETEPFYNNKLQKICSISSAISTLHFNECAAAIDLNLSNDPLFISNVFVVPNIGEAINTIIYKQQQNFYSSVGFACFYELLKKYDKNEIKEMLSGLNIDEKIDLLWQECKKEFNEYPMVFRRGAACYKVPKLIDGNFKNKWMLNDELPIFTQDQSFLNQIIKIGNDIVRK